MTNALSWQNSISPCPASFCTPRPNLPVTPGISFFNFYFFKFIYFNWRLVYFTILYWFCCTSTWICHGCTRVPNPEHPSHLAPHTIPLSHPCAPAPSLLYHALNLEWRFISHTCFNAILPNHPTLTLSHKVHKTVLYICVSFAVSHTELSLPSF